MKVVALAGGVGGAKMAYGLSRIIPAGNFSVVVNTGDDFEHFGLYISPDIDTVCYTLAELSDPLHGWGLKDETWQTLQAIRNLDGPDWFQLGDRDLATHLERTRRLKSGQKLSEITKYFCKQWNIDCSIFPMTDDAVRTFVKTKELGTLSFQEYFVKHQWQPTVMGFQFAGIENASIPDEAQKKLHDADVIVICPSNPWVSIAPILAMPGMLEIIAEKKVVAISPIIGGKAIKGPAAKMFAELGHEVSALAVAEYYQKIISGFVFDHVDDLLKEQIMQKGIITYTTSTIMTNTDERIQLAKEVLEFCQKLGG